MNPIRIEPRVLRPVPPVQVEPIRHPRTGKLFRTPAPQPPLRAPVGADPRRKPQPRKRERRDPK